MFFSFQNLILASGSGANQTVVLASPSAIRPQGGALVLQQGGTQQIVLPAGFQNIKTLQGNLQGIRVIPIAQASQANAGLPKGLLQLEPFFAVLIILYYIRSPAGVCQDHFADE
jgi:hypothetical protein